MTTDTDDIKTIVKRVTDYGPKPRSVKQALIQAHAFLAEEGQWIKGEFFRDGDPKEAYEKAECSSWSACAMGALGLVTGEMPIRVSKHVDPQAADDLRYEWEEAVEFGDTDLSYEDWLKDSGWVSDYYEWEINDIFGKEETPLSAAAAEVLVAQIPQRTLDKLQQSWNPDTESVQHVIELNDMKGYGRTRILALFEKAIRAKGGEPLPLPKASEPKTRKATK